MTISLRNLPPDIERAIVNKSEREGISLNKAATQLLETAVRPTGRNSDFDEFAGIWSAAEAAEFDASLEQIRRVDPADWKA
jgi:hypothetical protein